MDILLNAFCNTALSDEIELIIAGEFYTDKEQYLKIIPETAKHKIHLFEKFISDEEVKYYFCAADLVVQPYKHATQSGVTQIAYHFEVPMIVTDVGGLAEMVPDNEVGYVVKPNATEVENAIQKYFLKIKKRFYCEYEGRKKRFGWDRMVEVIMGVFGKL